MVEAVFDENPTQTRLKRVDLSDLATAEIVPPQFVIDPIVPRGYTTLFGGHGGSGKSIVALTLAAHRACGINWGPFRVEQGPVVFVSLEDPEDLLRYRLRRICEEYTLPFGEVKKHLELIDATEAVTLAVENNEHGRRSLIFTQPAEEIRETAAEGVLIVIDNASDAFDANENERRLVRSFVRYLTKMIRSHAGAVLLLAHIDKAAARYGSSGNTYSGSTAWHNSTRSRVALLDDRLVHEKLNVGRKHENPVPLAWSDHGVLVPDLDESHRKATDAERNEKDDLAVFNCVRAAQEAGEIVSTATRGNASAWHTLRNFSECPEELKNKEGKQRMQESLIRLARDGMIQRTDYLNAYRHKREKWEIWAA